MKKTFQRLVGTLVLGAASLALTSTSFAVTYSSVIGPSSSTFFTDGGVTGQLFTGIRSTRIVTTTSAGNGYDAITGTQCTGGQGGYGGPATYFGSQGAAAEFFCPGNTNLVLSQGGLHDW